MIEFRLNQAEVLALMTSTNTTLIPIIDNDRLVPDSIDEQRSLAEQGLDMLQRRDLLRVKDDTYTLNGDLGMMATALSYPEFITIITRDEPGVGHQEFLHYRVDPVNLELTMPSETEYRLAALPDIVSSLERIRHILPIQIDSESAPKDSPSNAYSFEQATFYSVKEQAETGQLSEATQALAAAGLAQAEAESFAQALAKPTLGGTIAFLRMETQEVIDGREIAMVQDQKNAWIIYQANPGESKLIVETVTPASYSKKILEQLTNLSESGN